MTVWAAVAGSRRSRWETAHARLKSLGELRDGVLVVASLTYVFGYLSWALYAARHGLGLIPAFDTQYFMAGVFPLVTLATIWSLALLLIRLEHWRHKPLTPKLVMRGKILRGVAEWLVLLGVVASLFGPRGRVIGLPLIYLGASAGYAGALFVRDSDPGRSPEETVTTEGTGRSSTSSTSGSDSTESGDRQGSRLSKLRKFLDHWVNKGLQAVAMVVLWLYLTLATVLPLVYFLGGFDRLPQEWGGPGVRRVLLDVDTGQISPEMRQELLRGTKDPAATGIVRTRPLYVVFEGSEFLYFSPREGSIGPRDIFRLRRSLVDAVIPVDPSTPEH